MTRDFSRAGWLLLFSLLGTGCLGPVQEEPDAALALTSQSSKLEGDNGLGSNGLGSNGLGSNGLGSNGLSLSALNSAPFVDWFNQDPDLADMVMQYIVECAVPKSDKLWLDEPRDERQVQVEWQFWPDARLGGRRSGHRVRAAAHHRLPGGPHQQVRQEGVHLPSGTEVHQFAGGRGDGGAQRLPQREACFFGNLFQGEGIFAGNDSSLPSTRAASGPAG